ncbi:MAG: thioredoxin domain-containing protein [Deltaproteobacteria bacterium]|nr:thioredoxin domain-containing protein [Deltaproteobacteria bacterium]
MLRSLHLSLLLLLCLVFVGPLDVHAQQRKPDLGPIPVTASDASWGKASAPVTLVMFTDLQCPYCKRLDATIDELKQDYGPKQLRVVIKHMPLPFHKQARSAAEAALALRKLKGDAAFFQFTTAAYGALRGGSWEDVARTIGVTPAKLQRVMDTGTPGKQVDDDLALAKKIGVRGTPNCFVNGVRLNGAQPKEKLVEVIDQQLAAARPGQKELQAARGQADAQRQQGPRAERRHDHGVEGARRCLADRRAQVGARDDGRLLRVPVPVLRAARAHHPPARATIWQAAAGGLQAQPPALPQASRARRPAHHGGLRPPRLGRLLGGPRQALRQQSEPHRCRSGAAGGGSEAEPGDHHAGHPRPEAQAAD